MVGLYEFLEAEKITFELVQVDVDDGIMIIKESHIPHDLFTV